MKQFSRANHYVPQFYLKNWATPDNKVWNYRLLVSNINVPIWAKGYLRSTAVQDSLYIRLDGDKEADDFETWLCQDVETPAEKSLSKAITDEILSKQDWNNLVRLLAAQFARTPARLGKQLLFYNKILPNIVKDTMKSVALRLEEYVRTGVMPKAEIDSRYQPVNKYTPMRVSIAQSTEGNNALLKLDMIIGRGLWLAEVHRVTTTLVNVLKQHKWHILKAAPGVNWCVSDDPVICLNYYGPNHYDFDGGFGRAGVEIIFPLSPKHIMFTHVGEAADMTHHQHDPVFSFLVQKFTIEHAFRYIYALNPWKQIINCRPRVVSEKQFSAEQHMWRHWNDEQIHAERALYLSESTDH
ncbi:MAG: DUF4238 domain-containing protein [Clostridiaceae bacterium]